MEFFYLIVLSVAVLFLLFMLASFAIVLKKSKKVYPYPYPSSPQNCPDYWTLVPSSTGDGTYTCKVPPKVAQYYNTSSIASDFSKYNNSRNSINSSDITTDSSGNYYVNFSNTDWQGLTGLCSKYKWATTNNFSLTQKPIFWDGITNVPSPC